MKKNERISSINSVLRDYFAKHPQSGMILAKEFMPLFIKNGIFNKDNRVFICFTKKNLYGLSLKGYGPRFYLKNIPI